MLALLDANLPLRALTSSITCAVTDEGDILLDPTERELSQAQSIHFFAFDSEGGIVVSDMNGWCGREDYITCAGVCKLASEKVLLFLRLAVEKRVGKEFRLNF